MSCMFDSKQVAARQLPVARGPVARGSRDGQDIKFEGWRERQQEKRRQSETHLQATVVVDRKGDDADPYADVPCTD